MRIKSGFGIRDLSMANHWSDDVENFKITKPTFICFGGNGTIDSQKANSQAARNERLMGLKPKQDQLFGTYQNIDVISFYYGRDDESDQLGKMTIEECTDVIDQLFLPLLVDQETNTRLPLDEACKNFSLLIFSSFCYGAECINSLMYDLQTKLQSYGFSREEIYTIYSHSFHLSYSPLHLDSFLPFMQINSFEDSFNKTFDMDEWFEKEYGYKLDGIKIDYTKKQFYKFFMDNILKPNQREIRVYTSKLINTPANNVDKPINEHSSMYVDLDKNWNGCQLSQGAKNSECVSKLSGLALATAGARALQIHKNYRPATPVNLQYLYDECQDFLESFNEEELKSKGE